MSSFTERPKAEGFARFLLGLLMLLAPAIYVVKVALADPETEPGRFPTQWVQTIVVTFDRWPLPDRLPAGPAYDVARSRAMDLGPVFAACDAPGPSAVSLWTGRFAAHHGVLDGGSALPEGTWTLASAAQSDATATGAFVQDDFVSRHGIEGFGRVVEGADVATDVLAARAAAFVREHDVDRKLVWLHVSRPGPEGRDAEAALGTLRQAIEETGAASETMWIHTALAGPQQLEDEMALRVPLFVELPTALNARWTPTTHLSQVDLVGAILRFLKFPQPSLEAGHVPPQSRTDSMEAALRGQPSLEWVWTDGEFGHVVRLPPGGGLGGLRIEVPPAEPGAELDPDVRRLTQVFQGPDGASPVGPDQENAWERYLAVRRQVLEGATKAIRISDS